MTSARAVELFVVYLIAGYYGVCMLYSALIHLTHGEAIATYKGWPVGNPIQTLYAFALIGVGVSALLVIPFRGTYMLAPAIAGSLLSLGGIYVHGCEMIARGFAAGRDLPEIILDGFVPLLVLILTGLAFMLNQHKMSP